MSYKRKRHFSILLFAIMCVMFCSCTSSQDLAIEVQNNNGELSQSAYFQSPYYIPLAETSPEAAVGFIDKVLLLNDRIAIVDLEHKKLLLFDKEGNFIASTEKMIGKGKNEYIQFSDCSLDVKNQMIYMYCDKPSQFMIFDSNLKLQKCIPTNDFISEFTLDDRYLYAYCKNPQKLTERELRRYEKKDIVGKYEVLLSFDKCIAGVRGMGMSLCGNDDHIYFSMPFSDEIHEIKDGKIKNTIAVDLGNEWFTFNETKKLRGRRFLNRTKDKCWIIQNVCSSDSVLFFNTNKISFYKIDKNKKTGDSYRYVIDTYFPYSTSWFLPYCGEKGLAIHSIPAKAMNIYLKSCKEKGREPVGNTRIWNMADSTANPVLQILKIK